MTETNGDKPYDLEPRTERFARDVRGLLGGIARNAVNESDVRQLARSSGSVAANYIEANESVSRKDFVLRIKTCRKEAKESALWLRLLASAVSRKDDERERVRLEDEAMQLTKIFGAILRKSE